MSHFVVLVIGDEVDNQLAPYHEYESTGHNEFVQNLDITAEAQKEFLEHGKEGSDFASFVVEWYGYDLVKTPQTGGYGYVLVDANGVVLQVIKRTNPNAKWDWYVEGGRWAGYLELKDGTKSNSATKGEIDFEGSYNRAAISAGDLYDKAQALAGPAMWESWQSVFDRLGNGGETADGARKFFWNQPGIVAIRESGIDEFKWDVDDSLLLPREQYVRERALSISTPYAVVKDGQWYQRGDMGWFGMSRNDKSRLAWSEEVQALISSVDDGTQITVIDCHI